MCIYLRVVSLYSYITGDAYLYKSQSAKSTHGSGGRIQYFGVLYANECEIVDVGQEDHVTTTR